MRLCKVCNQLKPYNPAAKRESKERGFAGKVCVDCRRQAQRLKMQGLQPTQETHKEYLELRRLEALVRDIDTELSLRIRKAKNALGTLSLETLEAEREKAWIALEQYKAQGATNEAL